MGSNKELSTRKCYRLSLDHDWEVIKNIRVKDLLKLVVERLMLNINFCSVLSYTNRYIFTLEGMQICLGKQYDLEQKVCLRCGECVDGIQQMVDIAVSKYKDEVKRLAEKDRLHESRQKLAKKLWKENCCNS